MWVRHVGTNTGPINEFAEGIGGRAHTTHQGVDFIDLGACGTRTQKAQEHKAALSVKESLCHGEVW